MEVLNRTSDKLKRSYTVLVASSEVEDVFVAKLAETAKKVRLDGFRPGKVPVEIVRKMYGDSLKAEAKNVAISNAVKKVIKDEGLNVSFNYATDIIKDDENGIEFLMKFELLPEFELQDMSGIEITKRVATVTQKEIDETLKSLADSHQKWVDDAKLDKASDGNKVVVDLSMTSSKKNKNDTRNLEIVVGDKNLVDDFSKNFVGSKVGETVEFDINYPAGFSDKTLAGKRVHYSAIVKKILKAVSYNVDDEFANAMGYENLEKAKAWVESTLVAKYDAVSKDIMRRDWFEKISEMYDFDVPENMLNLELREVSKQIKDEGVRLGKEITPEIEAECEKIARQRVRLGFIISELSKKHNIKVSSQEITQAISNIAKMYPGNEKRIYELYSRRDTLPTIAGPILESKVVSYMLDNSKINEVKCSVEELIAIDEELFEFFKDDGKAKVTKTKRATIKKNGDSVESDSATTKKKCVRKKKVSEE